VTEVSERDLTDVYYLLALLESDASGVVASQATDAQLKELQTLHRDLEKSVGNREKFFQINERFHMRLLEIADNRWRDQMVADLRKVMKLNRHNSLLKSGRLQESLAEHQTIMAALLARDVKASAQAMQTHFNNGLQAAI
jgi:DNA-binding GntR family transcriptional regulator